ncbi:hypothetical protein BDP55DRAFT_412529 [Colletotrichum godetiae]|uniref:Uncharacterized protein n=1 Tax=Colletotrichum godetiae TaxID=1209918 RepID=A0AAJ0ASM2_9PEZI|nr:uncharacterized protein BDP55DRAFT_412529 [Colletotrichum godetiae]KAK1689625.1 hypothetical protein BDP55DRAFT_412529 [Colletotrichum godetiae]
MKNLSTRLRSCLSLSGLYRLVRTSALRSTPPLHCVLRLYPLPLSIGSSVPLFSIRCACAFAAFRRHYGALCMAFKISLFSLPAYSRWITR